MKCRKVKFRFPCLSLWQFNNPHLFSFLSTLSFSPVIFTAVSQAAAEGWKRTFGFSFIFIYILIAQKIEIVVHRIELYVACNRGNSNENYKQTMMKFIWSTQSMWFQRTSGNGSIVGSAQQVEIQIERKKSKSSKAICKFWNFGTYGTTYLARIIACTSKFNYLSQTIWADKEYSIFIRISFTY